MHIPDEYVSSIAERYNLYTALSRIADEQQLEEFTTRLRDRFGPVPSQVEQLFDAMRLQWVAREIGFEKVSLKNNKLRGPFIADPASRSEERRLGKECVRKC